MNPLARCGCDAAVADHAVVNTKGHQDADTVTIWWRCDVCGARWDEEVLLGRYERELAVPPDGTREAADIPPEGTQ